MAFAEREARGLNLASSRASLVRFVVSVLLCEAAGVIGSVFTVSAIPGWYSALQKPWFTPPNWLFAPVWLTLYFLMGATLYLLWGKRPQSGAALAAFAVQLVLNVAWSAVFFSSSFMWWAYLAVIDVSEWPSTFDTLWMPERTAA